MNSKTKNQILQVLQKALEFSQKGFCVVFCKGKIPLEKHSKLKNTPRTPEELFKTLQELPTIPDSIAIKIPQNWLILDIDNKEERAFFELFKKYKFDWQETSRGYHIPVIFDIQFREDYERIPRILKTESVEGEDKEKTVIEALKEGELCVIWDIKGREWNCENILKIDDEVKRVIFASFRNMHSPKTQASTILEKFKSKREETGKNKLLWEWSTKEELLEYIMKVAI